MPPIADSFRLVYTHSRLSSSATRYEKTCCPNTTAVRGFAALLLCCVWLATCAFAQSTGGRFTGRVTDTSGAAITGATVTLSNEASGVAAQQTTGANGEFSFLEAAVGSYTITIDHPGFKKNVRKNVVLELNQVLTEDAILQVGSRDEVIDVTGEAPMVDTTSTQLGAVVGERAVTKLPLNARDTYQLLQLQPGVQSTSGADLFFGSTASGAVSVNGGRGRTNNFSVNGGDGNDLFVNAPAIQPTPDSIQEFRVISNNFDAEYGRNSGAVINVVTKSGTNNLHGSAYEFLRNKVLNAKGFFDPFKPDEKQNQFGGTFGGPIRKDRTFFFGSYEGRRIIVGVPSDAVVVPTAAERGGDFSSSGLGGDLTSTTVASILNNRPGCAPAIAALGGTPPPQDPATGALIAATPWTSIFPTSVIPTQCFDPAASDLLQRFVPLPNSGTNQFRSVPNARVNDNQFTGKVDHKLTDTQSLNAYYYFSDGLNNQPFSRFQSATPNLLPGFGENSKTRTQQANISHTWTLSNNAVNEARFTYFREAQGTFLHPQRTNLVTGSCSAAASQFCFTGTTDTPNVITPNPKLGITPALGANREGVPFIDLSGGFGIGNNFEGELPQKGNTFQWTDNFTKVLGSHTTKFGADVRRQRFDQTLFFDINGQYSYFGGGPNDTQNIFSNYLLGLPDSYTQGSAQTENVRATSLYLFGQDSWKIRPNVTLNYGLRWELNTPLTDVGKRVQTFRPGQATSIYPCKLSPASQAALGFPDSNCNPGGSGEAVFPLGLVVPGDKNVPGGLTATYYHAFAPRIGVAWSPDWQPNWLTGGPGKTSVRMGFGIFYNPIEQLVLEQFSAEPPFGGSSSISNPLFGTPFVNQNSSCSPQNPCSVGSAGVNPNPFNGILNPVRGTPVDWSVFRPIVLFGQFQPHLRSQYTEQYNVGIQRELRSDLVLQIAYVGSQGRRLLATHDLNFGNAQTCLDLIATLGDGACGPFGADSAYSVPAGTTIAPQGLHLPYGSVPFIPGGTTVGPAGITLVGLRPFSSPFCEPTTGANCAVDGIPTFAGVFAQDTIASSNYNSLQASLEKRFAKGLQFEAAYTYSKSFDDASSFEQILNPVNKQANRALSLFDARQRFVFSYFYELPIPKYEGFKSKVLNGWAVSGITSFQSGFPIRIQSNADQELMNSFDFELPGKPDQIGPFRRLDPKKPGNIYFDTSVFQLAALGSLGNARRTICCGPGLDNTDFSAQKVTPLTESTRLEFRAEFFNLFNHAQFLNPDGNISDGSDFGRIKRTREPRAIQFALKLSF